MEAESGATGEKMVIFILWMKFVKSKCMLWQVVEGSSAEIVMKQQVNFQLEMESKIHKMTYFNLERNQYSY